MRLSELEPTFRRREVREGRVYFVLVARIEEAQGVEFLCPGCFVANGGPVGTHMVLCWSRSRGIADDVVPGPGRWALEGTGLHDLTLNGDGNSRSILLALEKGCCGWHGYVTNGEVTDA